MSMAICENEKQIVVDTAIGLINIVGCEGGLHRLQVGRCDQSTGFDVSLTSTSNEPSVDNQNMPVSIVKCLAWLRDYFNGQSLPKLLTSYVDNNQILPICSNIKLTEFRKNVYIALMSKVPFGSTITYGELATIVGNPKASRAVGSAMRHNPIALIVPCHRVIKHTGDVGKYDGQDNPVKQSLIDYEYSAAKGF